MKLHLRKALRGSDNAGYENDSRRAEVSANGNSAVSEKAQMASSDSNKVELKRELGLFSGIGLIVGTMIGSGIFVSPSGVLEDTGSVGASLLVWAGCGLVSLLGALCYLELGCIIPQSGGEIVYIKSGLGDFFSFITSIVRIIVLQPASCAIVSLAFADYILSLAPNINPTTLAAVIEAVHGESPIKSSTITVQGQNFTVQEQEMLLCPEHLQTVKTLVALCSMLIITFANCWSVKLAAGLQNFFTVAKVIAILIIIIGGIYNLSIGQTQHLARGFEEIEGLEKVSAGSVAYAFYSGLWSYDGWNQLNYVVEELENPVVNLKRSIIIGIPMVTVLYISVIISYLTVLSPENLIASPAVAVDWSNNMLGVMSFLIPLSVAMSTFGTLNGTMFTAGRVCFSSSREGHMPRVMSYVNISRLTPALALLFNALISVFMILAGDIGGLIDLFSFVAWIFYGASFLSLLVLRFTRKNEFRPFKVIFPIPVAMVAISIYFIIGPIVKDPLIEYLYVTAFVVAVGLLYIPMIYYGIHIPGVDQASLFLQKLLNIVPTHYE